MKNLIILLTFIPLLLFSQVNIIKTGYSDVYLSTKKEILVVNIRGFYEDVNHLSKEKPKLLRLFFENNTFIELPLLDDNFTHDETDFYYVANFYISDKHKNILETYLIKDFVLSFKYFQVSEKVKTKKSLKFYYYINSKCQN